ncbi:malic acid transport protein [Naviculisporaceae sp. PSN 640]
MDCRGRDTAASRVTSAPEETRSSDPVQRPAAQPPRITRSRTSPISGYESPEDDNYPVSPSRPATRWASPSRDHLQHPAKRSGSIRPPPAPSARSVPCSLNGMLLETRDLRRLKVGIRDRISCYQWTWFTMNMVSMIPFQLYALVQTEHSLTLVTTQATGGIANVLYCIPFRSDWLYGIGLAFFFLNLVLFVTNCVLISLRFHWNPGSLLNSFTDQFESLFIPSFLVSIATIFITVCQYGLPEAGPWLLQVMEALFWIYVGAAVFASAGMYLTLWSTQVFPIHIMTPVWVFPAYPLLLAAPFGANLISGAIKLDMVDSINTIVIALTAITVQGTGFLIGFMICAAFLYRLMTQKLPRDAQRPGVFISIGPSGFTAAGIVHLGFHAPEIFPTDFMGAQQAVSILRLVAYMAGLWLWGLSIWFFLVSVGSLWKYLRPDNNAKIPFQMTWFSFVFPNTALVTATEQIGTAFGSRGLQIFGCVLACCIILVWMLVFTMMLRCLWTRRLLWPKDDE